MSCLGANYNPPVTRQWSRFENACAYIPQQEIHPFEKNKTIYVPFLNRSISANLLPYEFQMVKKGNVLEHRQNKAVLTKKQSYAQLARGMKFIKKTYAVQSQTYTNPNVLSLKRSNYSGITSNGVLTNDPITCPPIPPTPIGTMLPYTNNGNKQIILPPPVPPRSNKNPTLPTVTPIVPPAPIVYPAGGTLQCNTTENICTGEVIQTTVTNSCNDTTCSDVPGPIIELCYRKGIDPWLLVKRRVNYPGSGGQQNANNFTEQTRVLLLAS